METYEIQLEMNQTLLHHIELATGVRHSTRFALGFFNLQSDPSQDLLVLVEKNEVVT